MTGASGEGRLNQGRVPGELGALTLGRKQLCEEGDQIAFTWELSQDAVARTFLEECGLSKGPGVAACRASLGSSWQCGWSREHLGKRESQAQGPQDTWRLRKVCSFVLCIR